MSAEATQVIRRPKGDAERTDFPTIAFRPALQNSPIDSVEETRESNVSPAGRAI
ncbi:MAG: hypothetical protein PS018_20505 [bacterium]|nr:hypothetical protein [bacterium]